MSFTSLSFLVFLPIVFAIYWALQRRLAWQNMFLLVASYVFYGWWDWRFLLLIFITSLSSYVCGIAIQRWRHRRNKARMALWGNVVLNLGILACFKYFNFFADNLAAMFGLLGFNPDMPTLNVILPVGISFYTFQSLGYVIDIYRQKMNATTSPLSFFTYIAFFPQLVAGPIERASGLLPQIQKSRQFNDGQATEGLRRMLWGFFKKMVVADNCALGVDAIWNDYADASPLTLIAGMVLFSFQIYGDFSGYSDIAIGTARLFGIELMENFRLPYLSRNMVEFWRRWHVSLMTWFRDYVYIPLGGSRGSTIATVRNTLIVFFLSGLWHGANYTFIVWGLYNGGLILLARFVFKVRVRAADDVASLRQLPSILLTFVLAAIGWVIFRSDCLAEAVTYLSHMLDGLASLQWGALIYGRWALLWCVLLVVIEWFSRRCVHPLASSLSPAMRWTLYYLLLAAIIFGRGEATTFIYFQF